MTGVAVMRSTNATRPPPTLKTHTMPTAANTKHLYNICTTSAQRLRRSCSIVQMLYKCFVLAGTEAPVTDTDHG